MPKPKRKSLIKRLQQKRKMIRRQIARREAKIAQKEHAIARGESAIAEKKQAMVHVSLGLTLATASLSPRRNFTNSLVIEVMEKLIERVRSDQLITTPDEFDFEAASDGDYLLHFMASHLRQALERDSFDISEIVDALESMQLKVKTCGWEQVDEARFWIDKFRSQLPEQAAEKIPSLRS